MPEPAAPTRLPYGSWPTPVTSELVVRAAATLGAIAVDDDVLWWSEARPEDGGRVVVVRDGVDVLPAPWNARTAAHEYGGGAWWVRGGVLWFANWSDQRLYRLAPGGEPVPITPEPASPRGDRWADGDVHPAGDRIACVREHHAPGGGPAHVRNEIVVLAAGGGGEIDVVARDADFVAAPRWSPDGRRLCWLEWDHPNMPWDGTRLRVDGELVAGGPDESITQPRWGPDGTLWFVSDRTGWWNLYCWTPAAGVEPAVVLEGEIGVAQWVFGLSRYDLLDGGRVVLAYLRDGLDHLAVWDGRLLADLDVDATSIPAVVARGSDAWFIGASPTREPEIHRVRIDDARVTDNEVVRPARDLGVDPAWWSVPQPVDFPSAGSRTAHALYYPPTSPTHAGPAAELPPLVVHIHGGPTGTARPYLDLGTQYWTSRGFAVVDVNYGGSTGYGREYRRLLDGQWGVVDVEDCRAAVRWLADRGLADRRRCCITGGSAGGFTALAALAGGDDTFAAGASHYGVADLEALATETHKFESHYLDRLIGEYPAQRDRYVARSPIHHLDAFDRPLIVLQGLEDEVVPPNQAEAIVAALVDKGVPVAYVPFAGEQHGFRQAANVRRALDAELSFYAQVLRFELPVGEGIEPVEIVRP